LFGSARFCISALARHLFPRPVDLQHSWLRPVEFQPLSRGGRAGPTLYSLHRLFDTHAHEQDQLVDTVAERIQLLGAISLAMAHDVVDGWSCRGTKEAKTLGS
jgi:hypothetical protein